MLLPSCVAVLGYVLAAARLDDTRRWPRVALVVGWLAHALALAVDIGGWGSSIAGARFGFGPALSATVWLVIAVYAVESRFVPLPHVRRTLALLGGAVVALAVAFPGEFRPHVASPWTPLHWLMGIASYGLFGAAVLHAALLNAADRRLRSQSGAAPPTATGMPLLRLERLTFNFVTAGFIVLSATLLLGWWATATWRWDHKTVLSVLGWIVLAGLMIGRNAFGWRGKRATRWLYAGAGLLLLAYAGSHFVLEVLLHRPTSPGA
jgi:ABC-type uncharacterized transport system permease subunit